MLENEFGSGVLPEIGVEGWMIGGEITSLVGWSWLEAIMIQP